MDAFLRFQSLILGILTSLVVSIVTVPTAFAVQPMTTTSALGEGGKGKFGIGMETGSVQTVSVYKEINDFNFVQLAGNLRNDRSYIGTIDYCERFTGASPFANAIPYVGLGLVSLYQTDGSMIERIPVNEEHPKHNGLRVPFGINYNLPMAPVQIGAEIAPSVIVAPETVTYIQGTVGARVMF